MFCTHHADGDQLLVNILRPIIFVLKKKLIHLDFFSLNNITRQKETIAFYFFLNFRFIFFCLTKRNGGSHIQKGYWIRQRFVLVP